MIVLEKTILSDDIAESHFVCDLAKCKGACCIEGDAGAPLAWEEIPILKKNYQAIKTYLTKEGIEEIERTGIYENDDEPCTPTIGGRLCAYGYYEGDTVKCGIEAAWKDGKTGFQKPISCHLYPIRIESYDEYDAVNYHRWQICDPACDLGKSLKVPLYRFLKDALVRKYGEQWYQSLVKMIKKKS